MDVSSYDVFIIPVILISLTVHEYSHARVAYMLGDDTAQKLGRLSLNPLRHLDPIGVLFFYFMHFGWAKPVPVNWKNLADPRRDMLFIAAAGPASNLVLAVLCGFFLRVLEPSANPMIYPLLCLGIFCNVLLAVFNMFPVFPLDGSSVLKGLVPARVAHMISHFDKFSGIALLVLFLVDRFAETHIFGMILFIPTSYVVEFLTQESFPAVFNEFAKILNS